MSETDFGSLEDDEEREFLLRSLLDLDAEYAAGDLSEEDYRVLRDQYTARAAAALRGQHGPVEQSGAAGDVGPAAGRVRPVAGRNRRLRSVAMVAVLVAVAAAAGYGVAKGSGERLATDEVSGNITEGTTDRITKAQILVSEGRILDAVKIYDDLLADDPQNPVALAQRGWLISRVDPSLVDSGLASIDKAIAVEPSYPDAYFFRGMILWRSLGRPADAVEAFQRGIDAKPPADLLGTFEQVKAQAQADAESAATSTTAPPASP